MNRYLDVVFNTPVHGPFTYALTPAGGSARRGGRGKKAAAGGPTGTANALNGIDGAAPSGIGAAKPGNAAGATDGLSVQSVADRTPGAGGECGIGFRVKAPFGPRTLVGFVVGARSEPPTGDYTVKAIEEVIDAEPLFDDAYLDLARWVAGMYFSSLGEALATMLPGGKRESRLPVLAEEDDFPQGRHSLSSEQQSALEGILGGDPERSSYLFGVTGSGKTEVYLRAAERTIAEGRGVIYLVPEISLTHQLVDVVRSRFEGRVAVLHSGLTPSQKLVEWLRIRRGEATLVIGARSAVFAPVPRLGLVVIDEEHEGSYKSGSTPRYHARQVAMHRAAASGARLVMGSATPSVEAAHLMGEGRIIRHLLSQRLSGGSMPQVTVVDMKGEEGNISRLLSEEIRRTHEEGRQSILFLNRRGFTYFFHCRSCGYEMTCARCSVSMTFHKDRNRMVCHYCGYSRKPVEVCPACGSLDVGYSGFGTEMVEEEVRRRFPELTVVRVDTDAIHKKGSLRSILAEFRDGKIDLLLGTQMVAKGLNFPGVKLVGIVLADTGLHLPDFRAQERTFSLIVQVSGRAGRYFPDGKVVVQTYRPDNEAVMLAATNRIEEFYARELAVRNALRFPPFARLFRLVFRGKDRGKVTDAAAGVAKELEAAMGPAVAEILGPAECPVSVIAGSYRCQIILRTTQFSRVHAILGRTLAALKTPRDLYVEVDVDPVSLL